MANGVIIKALSGFYYVYDHGAVISCKAKGKFRHTGKSPLVGDKIEYTRETAQTGIVGEILPRKNWFVRPNVANVDALVFVACGAKPVTDPYLIDRVSIIAEHASCDTIVVLNKIDLNRADDLYEIYRNAGFTTVRTSAVTGEGLEELKQALHGKITAFTGNSGAGKSSLLNCLIPGAQIETAEISDKLGRGKHTTRHIEIYALDEKSFVVDTPGFASFEIDMVSDIKAEELEIRFREFRNYLGRCRFNDCRHINEPDCAITTAMKDGLIAKTRHDSYVRLYDIIRNHKSWE